MKSNAPAHSCSCGHCHGHRAPDAHASAKNSRFRFLRSIVSPRVRLAAAVVLFIAAFAARGREPESLSVAFFTARYLIAGTGVILEAFGNVARGHVFTEHFLMTVATIGAFVIGEYAEGCAVMLLYLLGSELEDRAVDRTRRSIEALRTVRPDIAHLITEDGTVDCDPSHIRPGDRILIYPGERVPLDSTLLSESASLDYSALTGESQPVEKMTGDDILAGAINGSRVLTLLTLRDEQHSAVMRIMKLAEEAEQKKTTIESFTARFARFYTPVVVCLAVLLAFLPPLLMPGQDLRTWVYRALSFLVISCPCALVISVPLAFIAGMGSASKRSILIRGSQYLEALADLDTIVFDKTGTLTTGDFSITRMEWSDEFPKEDFLRLTADLERHSHHPLAQAAAKLCESGGAVTDSASDTVRNAARTADHRQEASAEGAVLTDIHEIAGLGMSAEVSGKQLLVGNRQLLEKYGIHIPETLADIPSATLIHTAYDRAWIGTLYAEDTLREGAADAVRRLRDRGVRRISILSGDRHGSAAAVSEELGADDLHAQLLPEEKMRHLEQILADTGGRTAFVGDGINDAPALRLADIGISMGALGSDAAVEAADVVIMTDELQLIPDAVSIASQTRNRVRENVLFILLVKGILLALGAFGITTLWAAVFADTGVMLLAVLNALRASRPRGLARR